VVLNDNAWIFFTFIICAMKRCKGITRDATDCKHYLTFVTDTKNFSIQIGAAFGTLKPKQNFERSWKHDQISPFLGDYVPWPLLLEQS
jgi:hypothetical protein